MSSFVPFDLLPADYTDDPSVPLPPLPDVRRTPLTADEVLVVEGWDDEGWSETTEYRLSLIHIFASSRPLCIRASIP